MRIIISFIILSFISLACIISDMAGIEVGPGRTYVKPNESTKYVAETQSKQEVYVLLGKNGEIVPFTENPVYAYGASAWLHYRLEFWDVGARGDMGTAKIYKAYTPFKITGIKNEDEYTAEERQAIYARSDFNETYEDYVELNFNGGPDGEFSGINPENGKAILGEIVWDQDRKEAHVIFTEGIQQDYLIIYDGIPFSNWSENP
jgi:hypothetical protein